MKLTNPPAPAGPTRPALSALALSALLFFPLSFILRAQPAPPPAETGKTRLLSVADVVQMVLTNNLDIQISKYTPILDQFALTTRWPP